MTYLTSKANYKQDKMETKARVKSLKKQIKKQDKLHIKIEITSKGGFCGINVDTFERAINELKWEAENYKAGESGK